MKADTVSEMESALEVRTTAPGFADRVGEAVERKHTQLVVGLDHVDDAVVAFRLALRPVHESRASASGRARAGRRR